jgi:hypothetical protein
MGSFVCLLPDRIEAASPGLVNHIIYSASSFPQDGKLLGRV